MNAMMNTNNLANLTLPLPAVFQNPTSPPNGAEVNNSTKSEEDPDQPEVDDEPRSGELESSAFQPYKKGRPVWALQPTSGAPPRRACCMTAVRYNDKFYVYGGGIIKKIFSELYEYDLNARNWRRVPTSGECAPAMLSHTAVVMGNEMIVYGGMGQTSCFDDTYALNLDTMVWRKMRPLSGQAPAPRKGHTAVTYGGRMWVAMGAEYLGGIYNDIHAFEPNSQSWELICSDAPHTNPNRPSFGRTGHTSVVWNNEMLLVGGMTVVDANSQWLNDVHSFNLETKTWRLLTTPLMEPAPCGRYSHASWVAGNELFVFGGDASDCCTYFNDLWRFNLKKMEWTQIETTGDAPAPRSGHAVVTYAGEVYLFGGERPAQPFGNEPSTPCTPLSPPSENEVEYSNCVYRLPLYVARETTLADVLLRFCVQHRVLGPDVPSTIVERLQDLLPRTPTTGDTPMDIDFDDDLRDISSPIRSPLRTPMTSPYKIPCFPKSPLS